jgi:hypothetical protein
MENETQFDLNEAIRNWLEHLRKSSRLSAEELEELELHLRDSVTALQKRGLSQEEAWIIAERRLGKREALKQEFAKVSSPAKAFATARERFVAAVHIPMPTAAQVLRRILIMERDIVLPVKAVGLAILLFSFYSSPWFTNVSDTLEIGLQTVQEILWGYIGINMLAAVVLLAARRVPLSLLQRLVFAMILLDGVFILMITILVGGTEAMYWLFPALFARTAFSVPRFSSQALLMITLIICYVFSCFVGNSLARMLNDIAIPTLGSPWEREAQPILLRFVVLLLVAACCYGIQVLARRNNSLTTSIAG